MILIGFCQSLGYSQNKKRHRSCRSLRSGTIFYVFPGRILINRFFANRKLLLLYVIRSVSPMIFPCSWQPPGQKKITQRSTSCLSDQTGCASLCVWGCFDCQRSGSFSCIRFPYPDPVSPQFFPQCVCFLPRWDGRRPQNTQDAPGSAYADRSEERTAPLPFPAGWGRPPLR